METLSITSRLPSSSKAYVFGSILECNNPQDFDVLIIYDEQQCLPSDAYDDHRRFFDELRLRTGLAVHPTLLTASEAATVSFVARTGAVSFAEFLNSNLQNAF